MIIDISYLFFYDVKYENVKVAAHYSKESLIFVLIYAKIC